MKNTISLAAALLLAIDTLSAQTTSQIDIE
jgi:hypothetical protein